MNAINTRRHIWNVCSMSFEQDLTKICAFDRNIFPSDAIHDGKNDGSPPQKK